MTHMLNWMKNHKKLMILLLVMVVIVIALLVVQSKAKQAVAALAELTEETAFVERRSIQSSISSTGEIISDNTRNIAADLTGYEVLTVNVKVGDIVSEGDVLCVFDTEDLEDSLEDAEKALSAAKTQSNVSVNNAERALEMAIETKNYQIETAARNIISTHNAYERACDSYDEVNDKVKEAKADKKKANAELERLKNEEIDAQTAVQVAQEALAAAEAAYNDYVAVGETDEAELAVLVETVNNAQETLDTAQRNLESLDTEGEMAKEQEKIAEAEYVISTLTPSLNTAENAVDSAWNALQQAQASYDYTVASQESSFRGSKDALKSAEAGAGVAAISQKNNVDTINKQIEKGAVTADIGGTVTAVNINEGERYAGGPIVTIQDTGALVVSAEIDEYDIADVALGMKAVFKTDSTRDEQLTGEVIFISPTPTMGSDVTYQVKVRIDSDTTRLRIGMNAKLNIILEETADVLTVPYDAIQQDENGNDVIYAVERGEKDEVIKTAIPVTVGVEGDYYVEVSGNITEGMEISLPTDKFFDLAAIEEEMMASMGG